VSAAHDYGRGGRRERCNICGASKKRVERGGSRENYAYAFIHDAYPTEEIERHEIRRHRRKSALPPRRRGHNNSATPVFHKFVEKAIEMSPRYLVMITPSRWFNGGKGPERVPRPDASGPSYQAARRLPKLYDAFPGGEDPRRRLLFLVGP
jgi:site-specific DNA-methyltransferase (adenine-specific)